MERVGALKRRFRPDLIHIGLTGPSLLLHQLTALRSLVPTVITLHVAPSETEYGADKPVHKALRSANRVVAVSRAMAARVNERLPDLAGRCVVIYNALPEPVRAPTPVSFAPPRLLCVGRVTEQKGFDTAIAAMPRVREAFNDAELMIAGDGDARRSLVELARRLNVSDCVHMAGWVRPEDVPGLIDRATLVLMPSRWEPFGLVALQAAQRSRVCVASEVDGLPEVVRHEHTGQLVPPDEPDKWAAAICGLLRDRQRIVHLGAREALGVATIYTDRARRRVRINLSAACRRCLQERGHGMSRPTVSYIVAVYNGRRYLAEALGSILGQSRPVDEVVVVDDGSTDDTR